MAHTDSCEQQSFVDRRMVIWGLVKLQTKLVRNCKIEKARLQITQMNKEMHNQEEVFD